MAIFQVTSVKEFTFSFLSPVPLLLKKNRWEKIAQVFALTVTQ